MNQTQNQEKRSTTRQRPFRTLIVDDNVGSAKILGILFSKLGQPDVELAHCGRDAIDKAKKFCAEIIILDLVLGDMSGVEVARTLRQSPEFDKTLVVALSGNSSPEHRQQTEEAGFDLHLAKPVDVEYVQAIIARCHARNSEGDGLSLHDPA